MEPSAKGFYNECIDFKPENIENLQNTAASKLTLDLTALLESSSTYCLHKNYSSSSIIPSKLFNCFIIFSKYENPVALSYTELTYSNSLHLKLSFKNLNAINPLIPDYDGSDVPSGYNKYTISSNNRYILYNVYSVSYLLPYNNLGKLCVKDLKKKSWINIGPEYGLITCAIVSCDNKAIIGGTRECLVYVWALDDGNSVNVLKGHTEKVSSLAMTSDKKYLFSAGFDKTIRVWSYITKKFKGKLRGHNSNINALVVLNNNNYIASASADNTIRIWNVKALNLHKSLNLNKSNAVCMDCAQTAEFLISGCSDNSIVIWNLLTDKYELFSENDFFVASIKIFCADKYLITASTDDITVWHILDKKILYNFPILNQQISCLVSSPDCKYAVSATNNGYATVWDLFAKTRRLKLIHYEKINCLLMDSSGQYLISSSNDETVNVHHIGSLERLERFILTGQNFKLCFSTGFKYLCGSTDKGFYFLVHFERLLNNQRKNKEKKKKNKNKEKKWVFQKFSTKFLVKFIHNKRIRLK